MRLLAILALAAAAFAGDLTDRIHVARIATESAGGGGTLRRTLAAPALPVGPKGLLMAVGFAVHPPDATEAEAVRVTVVTPDGRRLPGKVVGADDDLNCTFFRVETELEAVPLAGPELEIGQKVLLLSRYGDALRHAPRRVRCEVEAMARRPKTRYALRESLPSWRGCIVATEAGALVGFVDLAPTIADGDGAMLGIGASTPVVVPAAEFADAARHPGGRRTGKAWLGVNLAPFDRNREAFFSVAADWEGALVTGVSPGSPAAAAGIRVHDLIRSIGPLTLRYEVAGDWAAMLRAVQALPLGGKLPCRIVRFEQQEDGEFQAREMELSLAIAERPVDFDDAPETEVARLGMRVKPATRDWLNGARLPPATRGVVVSRLKRASPARLGGVRIGDLVLRLDRTPVPDAESLNRLLDDARREKREKVVLFVRRGSETLFLAVSLAG